MPASYLFRIKVESGADLTSVDRFGNHVEDTRTVNGQGGLMSPSHSKLCDVRPLLKMFYAWCIFLMVFEIAVRFVFVTLSCGDANGMMSFPIAFFAFNLNQV